ncbi:uncharacterized protein LOC144330326 [Macaca mulatta]
MLPPRPVLLFMLEPPPPPLAPPPLPRPHARPPLPPPGPPPALRSGWFFNQPWQAERGVQTLGGVRGFLTVPSLSFPPRLLPLLLRLLQQLIFSCCRASAMRGPSAGRGAPRTRRRRPSPLRGAGRKNAGCRPGDHGPLLLSPLSRFPRGDPGGAGQRYRCTPAPRTPRS